MIWVLTNVYNLISTITIKIQNVFVTPEVPHTPLLVSLLPQSHPWFLTPYILPFLEFYINRIVQSVIFCILHPSLSIMLLKFIQVDEIWSSFPFVFSTSVSHVLSFCLSQVLKIFSSGVYRFGAYISMFVMHFKLHLIVV